MKYRRYRSDQHIVSDGTTETFYGRKVPFGHVLEATYLTGGLYSEEERLVTIGYETTTGVEVVLGFRKLGDPMYVVKCTGILFLESGEKPFIKIADMGDGGKAFLSCHGKLWLKSEVDSSAKVQPEDNLPD